MPHGRESLGYNENWNNWYKNKEMSSSLKKSVDDEETGSRETVSYEQAHAYYIKSL